MGKWFSGERIIFRGRDLHRDLGRSDWVSLYLFAITGRDLGQDLSRLVESIWVLTSYPDPRIWNNRIAAQAGTARSTGALGLSAALAVSEATIYGRRADMRAYGFIDEARKRDAAGEPISEIVESEIRLHRGLPGYGRPIVRGDERIQYMLNILDEFHERKFPTVELALEIDNVSKATRYRLHLNYAGLVAAISIDIGLSAREHYFMTYPAFLAGMVPCYLEASERHAGSLFPISCRNVEYTGEKERKWK